MNGKIYERQLIERLVQTGGADPVFMRDFLRETLSLIEEGLLRDGVVRIHNFGTFQLRWTKSRAGVNPRTGEKMMIPERGRVVFQPAKSLRELINLSYRPSAPAMEAERAAPLPITIEKPLVPEAPPSTPVRDVPVIEEPVQEEFDIAEVLSEETSATKPKFVFAETTEEEKEPESVLSLTSYERERLGYTPSHRRSKRFAWFAGSLAALLLLLLFVFVGRISERIPSSSVNTAPSATSPPTPRAEQPSPTDGIGATANGHAQPVNHVRKPSTEATPFFAGGSHRVVAGDNLWDLSGAYYRDHYLWPNIYRVNTGTISDPNILQIAQELDLPALYGPPENLTPADRRNMAEGYFLLYRYYKDHDPSLAPYALWAAVRYDSQIKTDHLAELSEDDLAFLGAHGVRGIKQGDEMTER